MTTIDLSDSSHIRIEGVTTFGGQISVGGSGNEIYGVRCLWGNYTLGVQNGFDSERQSVLLAGSNNKVERCEIAFGSGNGVYDKGTNNKLINCYVHDFNLLGCYDCVLNTRDSKDGLYKQNTLARGGRDIIQAFGDGMEFCYNDISWSNLIADDCDGIYTTNPRKKRSTIHHNWIHDCLARTPDSYHKDYSGKRHYKATGIYLDNNASYWTVHNNVVWNTTWTSIQQNWNCTDNFIYNNTFLKGSATMGAWHRKGTRFSGVRVWNNLTDSSSGDQGDSKEEEGIWEEQADKQNNMVDHSYPFVDWENQNFMLKAGSKPVNKGKEIDGITTLIIGSAPDVGAYELGGSNWRPGITWDPEKGPMDN